VAVLKILLFANTDWYLYNFRLSLANALRENGNEVVFVSPPGNYGIKLQAQGFRWLAIPMNRLSLNPVSELKLLMTIAKLYRIEQPDIAHHFTIKCVVYGTLAARLAGIKRKINAVTGLGHVFTSEGRLQRLLRPIVSTLMRFALFGKTGRLILQNHDDEELFRANHLAKLNQIRVIRGSGVDIERFQPGRRALSDKMIRVLLATRLIYDKGIEEYVQAARILKEGGIEIEFLMAGAADAGNPSAVPEQAISRWQAERLLIPLGHIDDMHSLLKQVDIVVLPSYREGTPRILLEAASCGLPIVATDVPGCREIVKHQVNGLLVPVKNPYSLANAIKYLAENPHERERMGKEGRRIAVEEFSEKLVIRETLSVYRELIPMVIRIT
jgi:glycosyltransferase involved in cell wall biosynthesis